MDVRSNQPSTPGRGVSWTVLMGARLILVLRRASLQKSRQRGPQEDHVAHMIGRSSPSVDRALGAPSRAGRSVSRDLRTGQCPCEFDRSRRASGSRLLPARAPMCRCRRERRSGAVRSRARAVVAGRVPVARRCLSEVVDGTAETGARGAPRRLVLERDAGERVCQSPGMASEALRDEVEQGGEGGACVAGSIEPRKASPSSRSSSASRSRLPI